jgi:hypothetical protein
MTLLQNFLTKKFLSSFVLPISKISWKSPPFQTNGSGNPIYRVLKFIITQEKLHTMGHMLSLSEIINLLRNTLEIPIFENEWVL